MRATHCGLCAAEKLQRTQAQGEAAGLAWVIQKARNRLREISQQLDAVASTLDTKLAARSGRDAARRAA